MSFIAIDTKAQKSDGSAKSLEKAELAFSAKAGKDGTNAAYATFAAKDALVFRPNPVLASAHYNKPQTDTKIISWVPQYTRISKSRDFGFTTGIYTVGGNTTGYGHYLSIWRGADGNWELILDMSTETNKPLNLGAPVVIEPKEKYTPVFAKEKERKASKEIILTTEKTLNATLKTYGANAFSGFIDNNSRLLFPGTDPIIGKENIQAFNNRMIDKIVLKNSGFDKALGGDLAYSYGLATIDYKNDLRESFNYLYVWEKQADYSWNLLVQLYTLAER
ncbi:MAG: nuclear transport factor 2 family protein [Pedobacter sp.]|nr:MAG: nuclear transport factor 2 family protein [Pedobacter sp.]